jgi:hypothetical protein
MDRLVSCAWLEQQLGAPNLRVLDCTAGVEMLPEGGFKNRTGRTGWERNHIPGSAHSDDHEASREGDRTLSLGARISTMSANPILREWPQVSLQMS